MAVEPLPGDGEMVRATGEGDPAGDQDDDEVTAAKETTDAAAAKAGAEEVVVATGPQPEGRRFSLADR